VIDHSPDKVYKS